MVRKSVISSNISSVGYDENSRTLKVEFNRGSVYKYTGVPSVEYENLLNAPSKGRYFNQQIKNRYPAFRSL